MTERSEAIDQLAAALVKAQSEFPTIPKNSVNPFFHSNYADLGDVKAVAGPILSKHGLGVAQFPTTLASGPGLTTILLHESGQFLSDTMPLLLAKADSQGQGSAITYARRYAYMAALGLVADEDDDGNASTDRGHYQNQQGAAPQNRQSSGSAARSNPTATPEPDGPILDQQKRAVWAIANRKKLAQPDTSGWTQQEAARYITEHGD